MELLYEVNAIHYNSFVYKIQTQIPNQSFKIKIDLVKPTSTDRNSKVYVFNANNYKWCLLLEENFKNVPSTSTTGTVNQNQNIGSFGINSQANMIGQPNTVQRDEKIKNYLECVYKLLCN